MANWSGSTSLTNDSSSKIALNYYYFLNPRLKNINIIIIIIIIIAVMMMMMMMMMMTVIKR